MAGFSDHECYDLLKRTNRKTKGRPKHTQSVQCSLTPRSPRGFELEGVQVECEEDISEALDRARHKLEAINKRIKEKQREQKQKILDRHFEQSELYCNKNNRVLQSELKIHLENSETSFQTHQPAIFLLSASFTRSRSSKELYFIDADFNKMGTKTSIGLRYSFCYCSTLLAKLRRPKLVCNFRDSPLTQLLEPKFDKAGRGSRFVAITNLLVPQLLEAGTSLSSRLNFLGRFTYSFSIKKTLERKALSFLEDYFP